MENYVSQLFDNSCHQSGRKIVFCILTRSRLVANLMSHKQNTCDQQEIFLDTINSRPKVLQEDSNILLARMRTLHLDQRNRKVIEAHAPRLQSRRSRAFCI